jgi:hypothetical protein
MTHARHLLCTIAIAAAASGCGRKDSDYLPAADAAKQSLLAALTAWSEGKPPSSSDTTPKRQFADFQQAAGKRLKSFRLLDEQSTVEASNQVFRVEIVVEGHRTEEVKYHVVGIDPLWIIRDRDFKQASME